MAKNEHIDYRLLRAMVNEFHKLADDWMDRYMEVTSWYVKFCDIPDKMETSLINVN